MRPFAFVWLLTNDSYLPGVITSLRSLLDLEPDRTFTTVCLISPQVSHDSTQALGKCFDSILLVEEIRTKNLAELDLLGRRDLVIALTKLHTFRLVQYQKVIYLDADTLVLRPLSHLFELEAPFSAAPDAGWPDRFNSGVFVCTPDQRTFDGLIEMMSERGSWDGADQGLLNDFFPNWDRLSFTYNVTPSAYYTYAPAYRRHASDVSVLHFIGPEKPWTSGNRSTASSISSRSQSDYYGLVNKWFDVFERHFGTNTSTSSIASRIVAPPASFKSNTSPQPLLTPKAAAAAADSTWNPALSSPPRESGFQMQESIGPRYGNVWDDSSLRRQKQRFEPPAAYAPPPASTHEWYRNVMSTPSDPTAVRPVFPWEETTSQPDVVVRPSPSITRSSPLPKAASRSQSQPQQTGFRNAWDQIPNIDKIAREFARATNMNRATSLTVEATSSSTRKSRANIGRDDLGGRTSSLKEPRSYEPRSEATSDDSSRDGDDEEDEENSISSTEKVPILFKSRSSSIASNDSGGERRSPRNRTTSTSSNESLGLDEGNYSKVSTSPTLSKAAGPSALVPLHHQSSHPYHHTRTLSYPPPGSPTTTPHPIKSALRLNLAPTPFASSPQLAAQAIRNTAATRVANGGGEGGAPVVSRRFTPETDVESMKRSSLLALRRVMDIEKNGPGSV